MIYFDHFHSQRNESRSQKERFSSSLISRLHLSSWYPSLRLDFKLSFLIHTWPWFIIVVPENAFCDFGPQICIFLRCILILCPSESLPEVKSIRFPLIFFSVWRIIVKIIRIFKLNSPNITYNSAHLGWKCLLSRCAQVLSTMKQVVKIA